MKLQYDEALSNFAFNFNLRRYAPEQQTAYIREWLRGRVDFEPAFNIHFYPGRYAVDKGSIVPVVGRCRLNPELTALVGGVQGCKAVQVDPS